MEGSVQTITFWPEGQDGLRPEPDTSVRSLQQKVLESHMIQNHLNYMGQKIEPYAMAAAAKPAPGSVTRITK